VRTAPAYQTLREQLRDDIAAGQYSDGSRLPTESELVERHGLSRQTVRRAFQDLVAEGAVYRVPGRGTYASESGQRYLRQLGSIEDLMSLSDDTTMEVLTGLRRRVDLHAASRLRLDDDVVYSVVFRRLHDGVPFVMTTVHLVPAVAHAVSCEPGHPMLRVDRLYSDVSHRPVELSVSHFLPEQYTYRVTLRRSG